MPLELWFVTRLVMRSVDLYLDTLYSAFEMIASGVTTVQHLHGRLPGKLDQVDRGCDEVIRAYQDVGMRVSYSYAVRDQNRLVYQRDEDFIAGLPSELRDPMQRWFERFQLTLDDDIALFEGLYGRYRDAHRVKVCDSINDPGASARIVNGCLPISPFRSAVCRSAAALFLVWSPGPPFAASGSRGSRQVGIRETLPPSFSQRSISLFISPFHGTEWLSRISFLLARDQCNSLAIYICSDAPSMS